MFGSWQHWRFKLRRWKNEFQGFQQSLRNQVRAWRSQNRMCPGCERLVERSVSRCPYCGRAFSRLDRGWLGKIRQRTATPGEEMSAVQAILSVNILLYGISLLLSFGAGYNPLNPEGGFGFLTFLSPNSGVTDRLGVLSKPLLVDEHQYWRLVTAMFLHAGLLHIYFNMSVLSHMGPVLERSIGRAKFTFLYLVTGIVGFIFSLPFLKVTAMGGQVFWVGTLGASGAIFGIMGALVVYGFKCRDSLNRTLSKSILIRAVLLLVLLQFIPLVNNWAHIGGFVSGGLLLAMIGIEPPRRSNRILWRTVEVLCVLAVLVSFVLVILIPPPSNPGRVVEKNSSFPRIETPAKSFPLHSVCVLPRTDSSCQIPTCIGRGTDLPSSRALQPTESRFYRFKASIASGSCVKL